MAARCDQYVRGGDALASHFDRVRIDEPCVPLDDPRSRLLQARSVCGAEPRDLFVLRGDERRPIEARIWNGPTLAARVIDHATDFARVDEELLRHATAHDARA